MIVAAPKVTRAWICRSCWLRQQNVVGIAFATSTRRQRLRPLSHQRSDYRPTDRGARLRRTFSVSARARSGPTRNPILPESPARTRFAPSPTGYLHIGGLRTALFSFLLARRSGGQFLLRIEDTDQKRLVHDAEEKLCSDLRWAGLQWDEGPGIGGPYGPYRQSERTETYQQNARQLLDEGSAYRCFCVTQKVRPQKQEYVTSGCYQDCASLSSGKSLDRAESSNERFTVRLRRPADAHKRIYPDLIHGKIKRLKRSPAAAPTASEDGDSGIDAADTILMKSDGTPTYHFANVVDDHLMKITHVIRGSEWMASTPLHHDIYAAFNWTPPQYAHVGLLVDQDKAKLSKRSENLKLHVASMREEHGVLPQALNNFLALQGWSNPTDNDVMDMQSLIQNFDLKFTKGNTMVKMEKLWFLQKQHVSNLCLTAQQSKSLEPIHDILSQIVAEVKRIVPPHYWTSDLPPPFPHALSADPIGAYIAEILLQDSASYVDAKQWVERNRYFFDYEPKRVPEPKNSYSKTATIPASALQETVTAMLRDFDWDVAAAEAAESASTGQEDHRAIHYLERELHFALAKQVWYSITSPKNLTYPLCSPPETLPTAEAYPSTVPQDLSGSPEAIARHIAGPEADEEVVQGLKQRYKVYNSALMMYLREKLAYGNRGPSISMVMALLGKRGCEKRLGLNANE